MNRGSAALAATPIVHVVDDDALVRESVAMMLDSEGLDVREHGSAEAFLEAFLPGGTGCVLLDLNLPSEDGLSLIRRAVPAPIDVPVVLMSGDVGVPSAVAAVVAGAVLVIEKPFDPVELVALVQRVVAQDAERWALRREGAELARAIGQLTAREREILSFVARGRTSAEVAEALGISFRTVEVHRSRILQKTASSGITELVYRVMQCGLQGAL